MNKTCLTPGTVWQFTAYGQQFDYRNGPARVVINLEIRPPVGKGGVPYNYPSWYQHGWSDVLTPVQIDELRDAVHDAVEPIVGRWQGNPDAAPKVASDTGAGLREALKPFVRHWEPWMDATDIDGNGVYNHPDDAEMSCFARVTFGDLRRARAALATDATDGATGGGHADTEGEAMAMFAHLNCPCCGGSGHIDDCATTPGGDLLEQAARVAEEWCGTKEAAGSPNAMFASISIAKRIRALSARNQTDEGGEK